MPTLPTVNEDTSARLRVTFFDWDDVAQAPTTATYRVDNVADDAAIRGVTSIATPSSIEDITLVGTTDNKIIDNTLKFERHRVTVSADYGAGDELHSEFEYRVRNLNHIS